MAVTVDGSLAQDRRARDYGGICNAWVRDQNGQHADAAVSASFLERFRSLGLIRSPCSASEVERLQNDCGLPLPAAYKAYLLIAGQAPPSAWVGSGSRCPSPPEFAGRGRDNPPGVGKAAAAN